MSGVHRNGSRVEMDIKRAALSSAPPRRQCQSDAFRWIHASGWYRVACLPPRWAVPTHISSSTHGKRSCTASLAAVSLDALQVEGQHGPGQALEDQLDPHEHADHPSFVVGPALEDQDA